MSPTRMSMQKKETQLDFILCTFYLCVCRKGQQYTAKLSSKFQFHDNSQLDFQMKFLATRQTVDNNLNVIVLPQLFSAASVRSHYNACKNNFHNIWYNGVCVIISILWQTFSVSLSSTTTPTENSIAIVHAKRMQSGKSNQKRYSFLFLGKS